MAYLTRMSWNSLNWKKPSGKSNKCKGTNINNPLFECTNGFGWEEWNFKFIEHTDGYCYGYLECFNNLKKKKIEIIDEMHLYTRKCAKNCQKNSTSVCYYIGYFKELEVLSINENEVIHEIVLSNFTYLQETLEAVNVQNAINVISSKGDKIFNIRFKKENLIRPNKTIEDCTIKVPHPFYKFMKYDVSDKKTFLNETNKLLNNK